MSALPEPQDVERFHQFISRWLGFDTDDREMSMVAKLLRERSDKKGASVETYLAQLEAPDPPRDELRILAQELTVTETSFFRDTDQMRAFEEIALPDRLETRSHARNLRILSAGCASGEEAYSLAILVRNCAQAEGWNMSIRGIDINTTMLKKAAAAHYSSWSLRQAQSALRTRYFRKEGRDFGLADEIRAMVTFEERNLTADDPAFWQPNAFDIVFCRNVMMYFTPEIARGVVARIARSLAPGGFLFVGHAETLRGLSQDFHLRHTHETFYYQRKDPSEEAGTAPVWDLPARTQFSPLKDDSWVDTIHRASERVESLTQSAKIRAIQGIPVRVLDLSPALELLRTERFSEARLLLEALPTEAAQNPEVLLLNAVLLTHGGDLAAAECACAHLLACDEMNAGAYYLMALCRESAGDLAGAIRHNRAAIYLDPDFSLPHLHLGLLARRAAGRPLARKELQLALDLLRREEASRILLFAGSFGRDQLAAVCRAELAKCAGAP
jgi:chemotaxis protein methyltransferase CheR